MSDLDGIVWDEEEEDENGIVWDVSPYGGATHPYVPDAPPTQQYGQLRGGAEPIFPPGMPMAGMSGNIVQEALNALLPERFAGPAIADMAPGREFLQGPDGTNYIEQSLPPDQAGPPEMLALNQPGLGAQDAVNIGAAALTASGGFGATTSLPRVGPALLTLAKSHPYAASGTGAGSYSLAQQVLGNQITPEEDISAMEIVRDTSAGLLVPALLRPLVPAWRRALAGIENSRLMTKKGELTSSAKDALDAAGIKYEHLSSYEVKALNDAVSRNARFADEARGRKSALDVDNIRATTGMISQRPSIIQSEMGEAARRDWSDAAIRMDKISDQMFPSSDPRIFSNQVNDRFKVDQNQVRNAYDNARSVSSAAELPADVNQTILTNMEKTMGKDLWEREIGPLLSTFPRPKSRDSISLLGPDGKPIREVVLPSAESPNTYRDLFEWRKTIDDPTGKTQGAFDKEMDRLLTQQLGGPMSEDAILAWNQANKTYREFSLRWNDGDMFQKLVAKGKQGGARLKNAPEDTWNLLFNASETGFVTKPHLKQTVRKIRDEFGGASPEMVSLRLALGRRMLRSQSLVHPSNMSRGANVMEVTAKPLTKQWQRMQEDWGPLLREVYPESVIEKVDNFVTKAQWLDPKGGVIPDNSYGPIIKFLDRAADATFRWARSGLRQSAESLRGQGVRAAETALNGPIKRGAGQFSGATVAEMDETLWNELYDNVLSEYQMVNYLPEWLRTNER